MKCTPVLPNVLIVFYFRDLLDSAPVLVVGTTGSLLQLNAKTLDICSYVDLHGKGCKISINL